MPHIFISYSKKDTRKLALALADALNELEAITTWVDRSLRAGRSWELQIQAEIDRCDAMIVLYSPDINRHKRGKPESYILTEIAYAKYTANKLIIPVMAKETIPPISLITTHYIDFTIEGLKLHDLVEALCVELEIKSIISVPIFEEEAIRKGMMPEPFDWIEIPNKGYCIAKYPITNAQFRVFVDEAKGYENDRWWTQAGWQQKLRNSWVEPRLLDDRKWNGDNQPVVGVSWYEAIAFCLWLGEITDETIMLPTEEQWQYAAQGDDDRIYPWGKDWNPALCNNNVGRKGIGRTTPVNEYEGQGDSPFGVVDMTGNVWEWCLTDYQNKTTDINSTVSYRALRGGSWDDDYVDFFRCDCRGRYDPDFSSSDRGFRIVRLNKAL